jgi:hypothetical protein
LVRVNPKYRIPDVALQQKSSARMYLVVIAWLYVALMMAVAEATSPIGTVVGAVLTFVLYGAAPVSLVVYLMGRPARRRAARRALAEQEKAAASGAPDAGGKPAADAVAPVRKEP